MGRWEFDAGGQSVAPNQPAVAPRFAAGGEQQDEAFRQLALALEHDPRPGLGNIRDRTRARQRTAVKQNAGIIMELPALLYAQFGSVALQKLRVPRNLPAAYPTSLEILH